MGKWGLPVVLVAVFGVMFGIFAIGNSGDSKPKDENRIGTKHEDQGQEHIAEGAAHVVYNSDLPSSGPHYTAPANWGVYDKEIVDETLIHNMEHGGIVIAYKPDLPRDKVDKLKQIVEKLPKNLQFNNIKAVLVPRLKNEKPIQLAAWNYTFDLEDVDEAKIKEFYDSHVNKGPELVP